ncbi:MULTISPECIES: universal stress protein [unclassified Undibacterium]|uniref:universal stress protein n=1 Tax=unclassified Undibacterium TaxID=2630295 RepID=UPI002AC9CF22|nr:MULTISPECIES: universal stress protein [unclassified Undibacterium]MEB0139350.1 universal stress protein [Undibacterium sp. CCC2.1]MEB0172194.1 universal stress protein [Undibacterium sp. CCC1.1]MEB0176016.1 universal stress protein [Undibacterium sp. CCC3.4]MEB0215328.1 universal stress protein [Undibacterium sp. 5I2]WPX43404.1 universal stress protein [Undibacterium sp. CCC3.4]
MSYKTILVHVDESDRSKLRVDLAAQLALDQGAHLIGTAVTGVSRFIYQDGNISASDPNLTIHLNFLRERAEKAIAVFNQQVTQRGVTSFESAIANDEAGGGIGLQARYSDLVVIGQTNRDEPSPSVLPDFPEYLIMNSGRPALIIPYAGEFDHIGKRPLISWDASREATRAVTDAIPLLKKAELVQVAIFNTKSVPDAHGEQPGADIALYLARHGIKVEVSVHKTSTDIGNALLSLAHDFDSDMLVMGGYGHSRLREMIMGGVTRTILESMTVPVFMSH